MNNIIGDFVNIMSKKVVYNNDILVSEWAQGNEPLILDSTGYAELFLAEGSATGGPIRFRGKFQEANAQNKNRRKYPFDVLNKNVKALQETIKARGLVGELDHPTDSIIHFDKSSHVITGLWWEGNVLMGEAEVLPTPHGRILEALIKAGVRIGISSRGVGNGSTDPDGILTIGENYKLITFDAVADPSTFAAYQKVVSNSGTHRESIDAKPVITNSDGYTKSDAKNNQPPVYNFNENALIAYLGRVIQNHKHKAIQANK